MTTPRTTRYGARTSIRLSLALQEALARAAAAHELRPSELARIAIRRELTRLSAGRPVSP